MLTIKRATLLPINCYYGISVLAKNEAVLISIPRYTVFSVYRPTLALSILKVLLASIQFNMCTAVMHTCRKATITRRPQQLSALSLHCFVAD